MNKVFLIGNLTRDPELRSTTTGRSVCSFSIAVNRTFANQMGERITDFFNIIVWGKQGENCAKYLAKGRKVAIIGELQTRTYEKDGQKRTVTEINASDVEFLSPRDQLFGGQGAGYDGGFSSRNDSVPAMPMDSDDGFTDIEDSDLPF